MSDNSVSSSQLYTFLLVIFSSVDDIYVGNWLSEPNMTEVINDALGLTQYLTKHLEENQAVSYLLAIQGLDIEACRSAKELLPGVVNTNRQWKEGHIKDCVNVFCNTEVKTTFLVRNLSLIPGFDRTNLHLATFIAAAARAWCRNDNSGYPFSSYIYRERWTLTPYCKAWSY